MSEKTKTLAALLISFLLTATLAVPASAALGFSANPRLPNNQRPGATAYFDLNVQPGATQELSILVTNESDEEMTVEVEAYAASTSRSGNIVYVPTEGTPTPK